MGVMTRTSSSDEIRHDTLATVTGKSGRGTARQTIRVEEELWAQFGAACEAEGSDRSAVLRDCIARYLKRHPAPEPAPEEG